MNDGIFQSLIILSSEFTDARSNVNHKILHVLAHAKAEVRNTLVLVA